MYIYIYIYIDVSCVRTCTYKCIQYIYIYIYVLIEKTFLPGGGFLFTMFPDQEPCVRDFTTKCDRRISS